MKIKLSKSQWKNIGIKRDWIREGQSEDDENYDIDAILDAEEYKRDPMMVYNIGDDDWINISNLSIVDLEDIKQLCDISTLDASKIDKLIAIKQKQDEDALSVSKNKALAKSLSKLNKKANDEIPGGGLPEGSLEGSQYRQDFDIKKHVKDNDNAAVFVGQVILNKPEDLGKLLGLEKNEIVKRMKDGLLKILKNAPKDIIELIRPILDSNDYNALIKSFGKILLLANPPVEQLKHIIFPILGFNTKNDELLKRLYEYVPLVISGGKVIEEMVNKDDKFDTKRAIDSILDQYNAGKITKNQMENLMKEFASTKVEFIVTASGLSAKFIKVDREQEVREAALAKQITVEKWLDIGKKAGWIS